MAKAYILSDVGEPVRYRRHERLQAMRAVLLRMDFEVEIIEEGTVTEAMVESLRTQFGSKQPLLDGYGHVVRDRLSHVEHGDVIVATEGWHREIFRGLLAINVGRYHQNVPVVELWIDYIGTFARFTVFTTNTHLMAYSESCDGVPWSEDVIISAPYYPVESLKSASIKMMDVDPDDAFNMNHMEHMRLGIPICAPDYGTWRETVDHAITGVLYRSKKGRLAAQEYGCKLRSADIREAVAARYSAEASVSTLKPYFDRIING